MVNGSVYLLTYIAPALPAHSTRATDCPFHATTAASPADLKTGQRVCVSLGKKNQNVRKDAVELPYYLCDKTFDYI